MNIYYIRKRYWNIKIIKNHVLIAVYGKQNSKCKLMKLFLNKAYYFTFKINQKDNKSMKHKQLLLSNLKDAKFKTYYRHQMQLKLQKRKLYAY
jgi:hypothetical protein